MFVCMYVCIPLVCLVVYRGQKNASDTVELELEMVANYHVAAGNQTQVLWKNKFCFLFLINVFIHLFYILAIVSLSSSPHSPFPSTPSVTTTQSTP